MSNLIKEQFSKIKLFKSLTLDWKFNHYQKKSKLKTNININNSKKNKQYAQILKITK